MAGWNNGQVMEPGVYVNEPAPKTSKKKGSSGVQSGALSINVDDLLEALTGQRQGLVSEQPMPKQTAATKEPKETALKLPGLSSEMGGLAQALVGARRNRAQRYQATDPWSIGQSVIEDPGLAEGLGMKLDKPWKQGLFNIAQNLIGGYVGGKARQGLEEYDRPFMQAIQGAAQTGDFSKLPISSEDDPTGVLQMSLALSGIDDKKAQRDAYNKELVKNGMLMNADGSFSPIPGYAEMRGQIKQAEDGKTGFNMAQALTGVTQMEQSPYDFGTTAKPYDQKYLEYYDTFTKLGQPPGEAAKQAQARVLDDKKLMASTITDAKTARDRAAMLEGVVGTAEGALAKDPYVGPLSGVWNTVSSLFGGEGAQGYAELNSLKQDLQKAYRVPGSGAQSDAELRALIASGPSTDKTPEQNQAVLNKIKKAAENEKQYADFMENYVLDRQDVTQGRQAWERYRQENNPFDDKPDVPWQEYFKRKSPAQGSGLSLPSGLPAETQAYVPKVFQGAQELDMQTLLDRIRQVESGGNPNAVSPKGAKGAYQFLDGTAIESMRELGMDPSTYDPRNEQQQRVLAEHYITKLTKMLGSQQLAVAAYNAGPGRVQQLLQQGQQQAPAQMASQPSGETRIVNGVKYTKSDGVWKKVA